MLPEPDDDAEKDRKVDTKGSSRERPKVNKRARICFSFIVDLHLSRRSVKVCAVMAFAARKQRITLKIYNVIVQQNKAERKQTRESTTRGVL
uniref:Pentatricopeptide repeat-containing protein At5g08305 n=1 Tax=Rhizophora mucronata TaxID=61149 RepID=A0A2P2PNT7_RHIMU